MKRQLMVGASALALITAAGGGIALADITQTVGNDTPDGGGSTSNSIAVTVTGGLVSTGEISGMAAQAGIGTTGALASVFATDIGGAFNGAPLGVITQTVVNLGEIVNGGNTVTVGGDISGHGGLGSIAGTGAAASVGETLIAVPGLTVFSGGNTANSVTSMVYNGGGDPAGGAVGVTDARVSADLLSGNASGLSVAGTGATADVNASAIWSNLGDSYVAPVIDTITQGSSNGTPGPVTVTNADVDATGLAGLGASASASATGAATAVRNSSVNSDGALGGSFGATGGITQGPGNYGEILNKGARVDVAGQVSGDGASATIGATGASAAVGVASISSGRIGSSTFGDITQGTSSLWAGAPSSGSVYNRGAVDVTDAAVRTGELAGAASSLGIGATGAAASVFEQDIGSTGYPGAAFGSVDSTVLNVGDVTITDATVLVNDADSSVPNRMRISGDGASAFISAAGAAASVSSNSIGGSGFIGGTFLGDITQDVTNAGHILVEPGTGGALSVTARNISGHGASASISAVGATASVSSAAIDGADFTGPVFAADINQTVTNASATDPGVGSLTGSGTVTVTDATVNVYALSGDGASAAISAAGASAGVSALGIGVDGTYTPLHVNGNIGQTVTNGLPSDTTAGSVSITGSSITARDLSGAGSSASIAAVGASASVTGTVINVAAVVGPAIWYGDVTQSTTNHAPINVASATITTGALTGAGASAGISAVGASAVVGVTSIGSGVAP